jgi:adenylate cyclase
MTEFFQRLKERKLVQWTVAYVAATFALLQGIDIVAQRFSWPDSIERILIIAACTGFFLVLVLAWYHGERGAQRVTGTELLILALLLATGGGFLWRFAATSRMAENKIAALPNETRISESPGAIPEKSIAVLPFDNLSHDPDNAYFSEGIQDEILTRLAKIAELKVISRTSTQKYKSAPDNLREIAHQLGVAHILEGSVQKAGEQVRINVQLINALNDAHLWADTYDRKLTDIFSVESEVARAVAEALRAKLTGSAEKILASKPTENPEAHQLYLKGRYFWNRRTEENLKTALSHFQQAIDKDPTYALAYAGLADSYALLPVYSPTPPKQNINRAIAAARRALELDPDLSEAHTALANALVADLRFAEAEHEFKRAIDLNPNYATAHQWYSECLQTQGRFDEALVEAKKAYELDPLSLIINCVVGMAYAVNGQNAEAQQQQRRTLEMDPKFGPAQFMLAETFEEKGDFKAALEAYQKAYDSSATVLRSAMIARMHAALGRPGEARRILNQLLQRAEDQYVNSYAIALIYVALNDKENALACLAKSYDERGIELGGDTGSLKIDRRLDPLRDDPRFQNLLARFMGQQ